jgi:hypothetical protein
MRLFVHGMLLDPAILARRGGHRSAAARRTGAALRGWERVALPRARWPTLRRRRGSVVSGVVLDVPTAAGRRLAACEGSAYRPKPVVVTTANGNTSAHVWIAPGGTRRPWKE